MDIVSPPKVRALVSHLTTEFPLPRTIGGRFVLRELAASPKIGSAPPPPAEARLVLDVYDAEESGAIPELSALETAIHLSSSARFLLLRYDTQHGASVPAFYSEPSLWGHFGSALSEESIALAESILPTVKENHHAEHFRRVANALRLYSVALGTSNADLAILGFVSSIESLLSIATQELSFRISLLLGRFLGDDPKTQQELFNRMRDAYKVRSKLAHGAKFSSTSEEVAAIEIVEHWTREVEELSRLAMRRVLTEQLVEVFDSQRRHEKLLTQLLFSPNLSAARHQLWG